MADRDDLRKQIEDLKNQVKAATDKKDFTLAVKLDDQIKGLTAKLAKEEEKEEKKEPARYGAMKVDMQKADDQSRAALAAVRAGVDEKLAGKSTQANATVLGYTTQVVSGTNFFLKVQFGDALYAHIRVWRGFQGEHELHSVQVKQKDDPLEYFETDAGLPQAEEKKEPQSAAGGGMVCGGMRPGMQAADDDSRKALQAVRKNVDNKLQGASAAKTATILGYTTQVVAGTNFFMKVQFGDALYAHLRIWRGFQGEHELHSVQVKQKDDSLDYFENDKDLPEAKQEEKKEAPKPWLGSLITGTAQEGWALAVKMSRMGVKTTQPNVEILHKVRPAYSEDATNLIACSQVIAINFQTIAAVNNYWKK